MTTERSDAAPCCGDGTARGVAGWLSLAGTPAFGAMAVYSCIFGHPDMICSVMSPASSLGGMAVMYGLMSLFHAAPWLKLASPIFPRPRDSGSTESSFT
jgi:hypothetical protein